MGVIFGVQNLGDPIGVQYDIGDLQPGDGIALNPENAPEMHIFATVAGMIADSDAAGQVSIEMVSENPPMDY